MFGSMKRFANSGFALIFKHPGDVVGAMSPGLVW